MRAPRLFACLGVEYKMGDDGADDNNDFTIFLESRRGGVKLPRALRALVQETLTETFEVESQEEALALGPEVILRSVEGAGDDRFKLGHELLLARWLLDDQPEVPVRNIAAPQAGGAGGQETQAARPVNNTPETDKNTNKALAADIQSTSLTREQITALSLSIETGQVQTPEDVVGVPYGTDPKLTDTAKARRKAGLDSLSELVKAKDAPGALKHLTDLIQDLTEAEMGKEASIVTAFLVEMQQLFRLDHPAMIEYLRLYLRRYKGRAFQTKLDFSIYAQAMSVNAGKAQLSDEQKAAIKAGKDSAGKIEALTAKLNALTQSISDMKKAKGEDDKKKKTCNICGKPGHFAANCKANPKSDNFDEAFAAKLKAKADDSE